MRLKVRVCDTLMMHTIDTGSGTSSASLKFPCGRSPRPWCLAPQHQQPGAVLHTGNKGAAVGVGRWRELLGVNRRREKERAKRYQRQWQWQWQ